MVFTPRPIRSLMCALAAGLAACLAPLREAQLLDTRARS